MEEHYKQTELDIVEKEMQSAEDKKASSPRRREIA